MKILITGDKGFIGSNIVNTLQPNHEITTFEWGEKFPEIKGLDWVIHIGAITSTVEQDIEKVLKQNYDFSIALYKQCCQYNVNFQYSSSASIYGLGKDFSETAQPDPRTPYAWSKYLFERYISQHSYPTIYTQGFRYFNVYGPNEEHKGNQASPFCQFNKQAKEQGYIKLFENSENYLRDFIHVNDVINFHIKFFSVKESGIWNIGSGNTMSFLDIAKLYDDNIVEIPMPNILKNSYQSYTCADMNKTHATLAKYEIPL